MSTNENRKSESLKYVGYGVAIIVCFTAFGNIWYMKGFKHRMNNPEQIKKSVDMILHPEKVVLSGGQSSPRNTRSSVQTPKSQISSPGVTSTVPHTVESLIANQLHVVGKACPIPGIQLDNRIYENNTKIQIARRILQKCMKPK